MFGSLCVSVCVAVGEGRRVLDGMATAGSFVCTPTCPQSPVTRCHCDLEDNDNLPVLPVSAVVLKIVFASVP